MGQKTRNTKTLGMAIDDLARARIIAAPGIHIQERCAMLSDIAQIALDHKELHIIAGAWTRKSISDSARSEIGNDLVVTYLAFGMTGKAIEIAQQIPITNQRVRALVTIAREIPQDASTPLAHARNIIPTIQSPASRTQLWGHLACASKKNEDIARMNTDMAQCEHWSMQIPQFMWLMRLRAQASLAQGDTATARLIVSNMTMGDARIAARASIAKLTHSDKDLDAFLKEFAQSGRTEFTWRTKRKVMGVCIDFGRVDLARALARSSRSAIERCMLFSRLAFDDTDAHEDIAAAKHAFAESDLRDSAASALLLDFVRALARHQQLHEARIFAQKISALRICCRAYLEIHNQCTGKPPTFFEKDIE